MLKARLTSLPSGYIPTQQPLSLRLSVHTGYSFLLPLLPLVRLTVPDWALKKVVCWAWNLRSFSKAHQPLGCAELARPYGQSYDFRLLSPSGVSDFVS